ncbi:MAG: TrkA family potassium uptake protein [Bowdeniella nasicola]|nr:TrkA family potassium uptake protein [Bowdeniella nasicola]
MFKGLKRGYNDHRGVVVIGLGRFGAALAGELEKCGTEVLAIDSNARVVEKVANRLTHVVCADGTDEEVLRQLSVPDFSRAVVAIGGDDLAQSILTVSVLKNLGGIDIWAKASSLEQGRILEQMGIEHVFYPEYDMGKRAAHLVVQSVLDYIELGYGFALISTIAPQRLVGKTLGETNVRKTEGISVVAVRDVDGSWVPAHSETMVHERDIMLVVGPAERISRLKADA